MLKMDGELGSFMTFLDDRRLYEESMVVVVADHGEEFLDHGGLWLEDDDREEIDADGSAFAD